MALTRSTDPLVWIDCEMTGLNPETDTILSISCILTTHDLHPLTPHPYNAIITTPSSNLEAMSPWCISTHTATNLINLCTSPSTSIPSSLAATQLLTYIKTHIPEPRVALLAGNSVHVDKLFLLKEPWSAIVEYLHYRILDVSAIKEAVRRWCSDEVVEGVPRKRAVHSADLDVLESIEEARYYMRLLGGLKAEAGQVDGGDVVM